MRKYLPVIILSLFLLSALQGFLGNTTNTTATAAYGLERICNFWLSPNGVSFEGGSAKYVNSISGPIGPTAGYLLTQTTGQSGYVVLDSITAGYGVYTIQALVVNASSPPADEIALVLGPSSPVNFGGGAWPGTVSTNGGTMVGIEFYPGTFNGYSGPALFIYTSQGLALWQNVNAVPKPWQTFTLEIGVTSNEIWVAYYIGNQLVANASAYVTPTFQTSLVEIHASTGGAYAGFLLTQVGYFSNLQIATIQNAISMGLDYLLSMGEDINGYGYVPEYASPSVAFFVTYTDGSSAYFVPGAPLNSPYYQFSAVYGTPLYPFGVIYAPYEIQSPPGIADYLVSASSNQISVNYKAYYYSLNNDYLVVTGVYANVPILIFEANEVVKYANPSPGVWSIQVIVNINYTASDVESVQPYLASGFVMSRINSTAWEYTWSGEYFYPTWPSRYAPQHGFASSIALPQYPDEYFHSFRMTVRHVQEMMDMLTEESIVLSPFHSYFNNTVFLIQSAVGVWGKNGNQPVSYYAPLFGYANQPDMGINFYDAINNNWPSYKDIVFDLFFPYAYPYKSGVVVINPKYGGQIWAEILNFTIVELNATYSIGFGAGYYDPLAYEEEGLYYTDVGQWSNAINAFYNTYNYYQQNHGLYYSIGIYANGKLYKVFSEGANDTLRYALIVALGSKLAGNGYISWSEVLPFVNTLLQTQWQGSGYAVINGQETYILAPTNIGGFETGFTYDPAFATSRPTIITTVEQLWGEFGGGLSGGSPEEVEWPGLIVANAETTIASVQALALFLYYYYGIPLSESLSPYNAYLIP